MDHARRIGKSKKPIARPKCPSPPCTTTDKPLIQDDDVVAEDKRLANWRKWLANREKQRDYYGKSVCRNPQDLLINTQEGYRHKVEMKEFAKMTMESLDKKKADRYRGNPEFWVTPEFLPKHGNPELPDISITRTKKQLNAKPELERITLPELIKREKGLSSEKKAAKLWNPKETSSTLGKKLTREIGRFEAEESRMSKLAVKGTRLGQIKSKPPTIPVITITGAESFDNPNDHKLHDEYVIALKIQEREIKFGEDDARIGDSGKSSNDFTWSLIFQSSGPCIIERIIRLENVGTLSITYRWRLGSLGSTLVTQTPPISPFFFNKNTDLILPGQIRILPIWFRSRESSYSTELWTLITEPKLCPDPLVFRFWGYCSPSPETISSVGPEIPSIDLYLDRRIRDTEIQEIIEEILQNVRHKRLPSPGYSTLFVESEIFKAKNPSYFYHPSVVSQLREIYENATSQGSASWSLSLEDLRGVLVKLRNSEARNEALQRFAKLCRDCLRISLYDPIAGSATSTAYNLFCSFIDKFEIEDERVRSECYPMSNAVSARNESHGDTSSSTSASKISLTNSTPRKKTKRMNRRSSGPRISSRLSLTEITNRENVSQTSEIGFPRECLLYKEVLYIRIRTMLVATINEICGIVDTANNLNGCDK